MKTTHDRIIRTLQTAKGHIDGILKMIDEDRYCLDIYNQILAVQSILGRARQDLVVQHIEGNVQSALPAEEAEQKILEIMDLLRRLG